MSVGLWKRVGASLVVLTAAGMGVLHASPMPGLPSSTAGTVPNLYFDAKAFPVTPPGWSLRTDLDGFDTAPAALIAPPVALADQAATEGKPGAQTAVTAPPNPDTLPEPASILVLAIGLAGLWALRRPRRPEAASRFVSKPAP